MRARFFCLVSILALMLTPAAVAQQGHPLVGVWSGDWGPTQSERHPVVMELTWKDTTLSGTINPGEPDEAPIKVGKLDSSNWTVHLEAQSKDERGTPVPVVLDGKIDNLGSAKRTLTGTWTRGTTKGTFKLARE
jgi:hypothetical protein